MNCQSCGRKLKDTKSIERGYGPTCWRKVYGILEDTIERASKEDVEDMNIPGQMGFEDYPEIIPK